MKDSRIEWIGEIPTEWKYTRLKNYLSRTDLRNPGGQEVLSLYRELGVVPKDSRDDNHNVTSEDTSNYKYVKPGDFVVNKMKAWQGSVAVSKFEGIVSPAYYVYTFKDNTFYGEYFHYLLRSCYKDEFMRLSGGIRVGQWDLPSSALDNVLILIPTHEEQQRIATFLDTKCGEVDSMIALQEEMISELQAYKQSVITEAVTHGLNPNVKMKDSGIEWIGIIPEDWNIVRLNKKIWLRARLGWRGLKAEEYVDDGYAFLSAFNIIDNKLDWSSLNFIDQFRYDESSEIKLSVGDILLVKDGAGIGKCAIIDELPVGESTVNSSLDVITPDKDINYVFLYYFILSSVFQNLVLLLKNGMGVPHLTQENLKAVTMPLPLLSEQQVIATYLDTKCSDIDRLISLKQEKIESLKAYKQSIIYEYVTGKLSVKC